MSTRVYIPEHNIVGTIDTEMAYGAYVTYLLGGIEYTVLMDSEDYTILDTMFFDGGEEEE